MRRSLNFIIYTVRVDLNVRAGYIMCVRVNMRRSIDRYMIIIIMYTCGDEVNGDDVKRKELFLILVFVLRYIPSVFCIIIYRGMRLLIRN